MQHVCNGKFRRRKSRKSPSKSHRLIFVCPISTGAYPQQPKVSMAQESIRGGIISITFHQVHGASLIWEHHSAQPERDLTRTISRMSYEDMVSYSQKSYYHD